MLEESVCPHPNWADDESTPSKIANMQATSHPPLFGILANRELRECACCGARFVGWNWHNRCRDCYRSSGSNPEQIRSGPDKELKRIKAELEAARLELSRQQRISEDTTAKLTELERACAATKAERDQWKRRYYAVLARSGARPAIPPDILRRLLWLCHPDRHGDDATATVTTAWLLAQRSR